jgi:tyrosine-protein phosphatase SIW14
MCRTLVQEDYPAENLAFLESAGIKFFQFPIPGNKEPFVVIPDTSVIGALETILDKRNHPILVHCNAGKVRSQNPLKPCFLLFRLVVSVLFFRGLTL